MKRGVTILIVIFCVWALTIALFDLNRSRDLPNNRIAEQVSADPTETNSRISESNKTSSSLSPENQHVFDNVPDNQVRRDPLVEFMYLMDAVQEHDFSRLAGFYENMSEGPEKYAAFFLLIKTWAKSDPDAAMRYALSIKVKERDRTKLYSDIYGDLASRDPNGFIANILSETDLDLREAKSTAAVMLISEISPSRVIPVIETVNDSRRREDLLEMWLDTVAKHQPESLLICANSVTDNDLQQRAVAIAISEFSKRKPELAGLNYSSLSYESNLRTTALPDILKGFYRNPEIAPAHIQQWMHSNLITQREQDVAAATFAELVMEADMDASIQWLESIQDDALYEETLAALEKKYARKIKPASPNP